MTYMYLSRPFIAINMLNIFFDYGKRVILTKLIIIIKLLFQVFQISFFSRQSYFRSFPFLPPQTCSNHLSSFPVVFSRKAYPSYICIIG
jgi:hypothetical protein